MSDYTVAEPEEIETVTHKIDKFLRDSRFRTCAVGPALMIIAAHICSDSIDGDEYIVNEFRKCLMAAHVRKASEADKKDLQ